MTQTEIGDMFKDAFDTFKAFDDLTVKNSGADLSEFPTSIWQIINHLLTWQAYQLSCLQDTPPEKPISEVETWNSEITPPSEAALQAAVTAFKNQLEAIQTEVNRLSNTGEELTGKLKLIQEIVVHLSFHLGEVVLMRRMKGSYPMPYQMKEFLQV
ncbi:hypothetical protein [Pontibacter ruber]|uniref:DinB family protein n=1 Tax=Pontibacter ruber TaxID=1343895 RepID=A0ABW5CU97_9BACT|nr:hypothetical protein [Pontibacter ruber]